jgi:bacillolysin
MYRKTVAIRIIVSLLAAFVLIFGTAGLSSASPAPSEAIKEGGIRTGYHPVTGMLTFIGAEPSVPIAIRGAVGQGIVPTTRAAAVLDAYAAQFGVANPQDELSVVSEKQSDGRQVVRYQQVYQGVPVVGGELIVNMNDQGLVSMNGEVSPSLSISTDPAISADQARQSALKLVSKHYNLDEAQLTASEPALWIYDQRLLEGTAFLSPHIVWRVEVRAGGLPIRELVLVNALKGNISLNFNQVDTVWSKGALDGSANYQSVAPASIQPAPLSVPGTPILQTYNSGGTGGQRVTLVCNNSVRGCSSGDAANAHGYAYDTYFAYYNSFGRNSIDGAGMPLISNVNWFQSGECPNAFWDGDEMTYCAGLAADDVVGHELTHGVTEREANLFYFWESGAINESLSDVWGEYVDQTNGYGTDTAAVKWKMGEDTVGMGVIRDMKNPPLYGQPDSMTSTKYCKTGNCYNYDNGGVHTNSGVNNKAAYLMVDGGTFNGKTVTLLGWTKTLAIYYEAQTNLLSSGAGYYDLYYALYQACANLEGTLGITSADCQEVRDATDAVKMSQEPATNFNPNTTVCPTGTTPYLSVIDQGFESGTTGWTLGGINPQWTLWSNSLWPVYGWGPYAHGGVDSLYGDDYYTYNNTWAISPSMSLPAGSKPYLYFSQAYRFEYGTTYYYDGGVLEYTTNGGGTWTNASTLYSSGQNMKGTIGSSYGNPLAGKKAFVGDSHGYVDSRFNLTSLAGLNVQFRWSLGTDDYNAYWGWVIDDVQVNTCVGIPSKPTLSTPALNALVTDYTPILNWSDSTGDFASYHLQVDDNSDFSSTIIDVYNLPISEFPVSTDLPSNTKLYWRVEAMNAALGSSGFTASRYFRTAILPPAGLIDPSDGTLLGNKRPTFEWASVPGASGYTIQVSKNDTFTQLALNKTSVGAIFTPTTDLPADTHLWWRVKTNGPNGPSAWTSAWSFTTGNPPTVPLQITPANNALVTDYTPILDWKPSTIAVGTILGYYEVQVDDDPAFGSLDYNAGVTGDAIEVTPDLAAGTKYYWRVRAFNTDSDYSAWSLVRYFRTPFAAPTLILPADTAGSVPLKPTFQWSAISGATNYTLQVSISPSFSPLAVNKTISGTSYIHTTNLLAGTSYYWRVRANGVFGPGLWQSPVFSFTTGP